MTLSPKLGVLGISTLWHFRLPLPIQMSIKVASSPRLSGIGMPSPILWSHPLKMQRIVLLSSLLWWELGTNSLITGPGEWLSFRRFTSKLSWSWSWSWSDWADAQADLSLRWAHMLFCWFCHDAAQMFYQCSPSYFCSMLNLKATLPKNLWKKMSHLMTKLTKWHVRPAKTQISLGIRPVWSESSLCAQWVAKDPSFLHADSEDSDQTGRMSRLIWVFAGRTVTLLALSWVGSNLHSTKGQ